MKSLCQKIVIIAVLILAAVSFAGTYTGGNGTEALPYLINNLGDWQELTTTSADWEKHFELTADLDFGGLSLTPVGDSSTSFSGVFDGNEHVIRNAVVNLPNNDYVGLFGYIDGGQIRNIGIENIDVTGGREAGSLVGGIYYADVINCYATGSVSGSSSVGGLVGYNGGEISSCYSMCSVNGNGNVGGLVGYAYYGSTTFCYATGVVNGNESIGALVGQTYSSDFNACFWDMQTSGQISSKGGIGLQTSAMQDSRTYLRAYWDFKGETKNGTNDTWAMPQGGGYPVLAWQLDDSPLSNDEMGDSIAVTAGTPVSSTTVGATGLDITRNGYDDLADVWYHFDCTVSGKYTVTIEPDSFNSTVAVFDAGQTEIVFNDDFFGDKSVVILRASAGQRYYIRVAGYNGQTGDFTLAVEQGAIQAIQGDLNYDGMVNLVDFVIFAGHWLEGTSSE